MDATRMRQLLLDPKLQPILAILKGARAGLVCKCLFPGSLPTELSPGR